MYKNEMQDEITDEELLNFMKEQFETVGYGDLVCGIKIYDVARKKR